MQRHVDICTLVSRSGPCEAVGRVLRGTPVGELTIVWYAATLAQDLGICGTLICKTIRYAVIEPVRGSRRFPDIDEGMAILVVSVYVVQSFKARVF